MQKIIGQPKADEEIKTGPSAERTIGSQELKMILIQTERCRNSESRQRRGAECGSWKIGIRQFIYSKDIELDHL